MGVLERLQAPLTPPSAPAAPVSRERQRDDAQLPGRCLRVPAGFPGGTPGQGDAGLRAVPRGRGTACTHASWGTKARLLPGDTLAPHGTGATSARSSGVRLKRLCRGGPQFRTPGCCKVGMPRGVTAAASRRDKTPGEPFPRCRLCALGDLHPEIKPPWAGGRSGGRPRVPRPEPPSPASSHACFPPSFIAASSPSKRCERPKIGRAHV